MSAPQRILRVRRQYNQWVANETFEDYALRFTARSARRTSHAKVANTAIGAISFLALEAIGGLVTLNCGFTNAVLAILTVSVLIFATSLAVGYAAATYGLDIDLLTRGAGFGYIGSTISSMIYAIFTFIFFAIEAAIMAMALHLGTGLPLAIGYAVSALAIVPIVIYGISFISRLQLLTQPLWALLQLLPFLAIAYTTPQAFREWAHFPGLSGQAGGFHFALFGAAASVVFSLMGQIGEQVDFLRFMPERRKDRFDWRWLGAVVWGGPGWILVGGLKMLAGSLLAVIALHHGLPPLRAAEPVDMYRVGFGAVFSSDPAVIGVTVLFVILSQIKINVTNAYAGSIAWSNFFARLTHNHPGRVIWLLFNVAIALLLAELGVYRALGTILAIYSNLAVAWIGALVADLVVNKPLGFSPHGIEFKRAYLKDTNPVGFGGMMLGGLTALTLFSGLFGPVAAGAAGFAGFLVSFVTATVIAWTTGGRHYLARKPVPIPIATGNRTCCICQYQFEPEDMAHCPAYDGLICSLCCTLDARCGDRCKTSPHAASAVSEPRDPVAAHLSRQNDDRRRPHQRARNFCKTFVWLMALVAGVVAFAYMQGTLAYPDQRRAIGTVAWHMFWLFTIIAAMSAWMIVLARESRLFAQDESERQTTLLMEEIEAHERTDAALQQSNDALLKAKDIAERANTAKSRYMIGISHELRSPLNAVMGYAQVLDCDPTIPVHRRHAIRTVRRSAEHMSSLIDGLLDISKIESGRLYLEREEFDLIELLDQMADMFRLEAKTKGLDFYFSLLGKFPKNVHGDAKRVRQILINLLSNAVKFTQKGQITFRVRYRDMFAEFEVADTGSGIHADDIEKVFEPFERGRHSGANPISGTGLGLTITRLLISVMGGDMVVESTPGAGSLFRVRLLLSEATYASPRLSAYSHISGYQGPRRSILIVDDDAAHCEMLFDLLTPLGFDVHAVQSGANAIVAARERAADLIMVDIAMPGMSGWEVARILRESVLPQARIMVVSGNAFEIEAMRSRRGHHNTVMTKPIDANTLAHEIGRLLDIDWTTRAVEGVRVEAESGAASVHRRLPSRAELADLRRLGEIGYVRGIKDKLVDLSNQSPEFQWLVDLLDPLVGNLDFPRFAATLSTLLDGDPV